MPGEDFYKDTPKDADFLEKFVRLHASPSKRHISQYEASRIRKIVGDYQGLLEKTRTDPNSLLSYVHEESKLSRTFSTNEGKRKVSKDIKQIFSDSDEIRIITGYTSMKEILNAVRDYPQSKIQIIFGNEPSPSTIKSDNISPRSLSKEMAEYWLRKGISILDADVVFDAIEALEQKRIEVKIGSESNRMLHAKVYIGKEGAIVGSSNFSHGGLRSNREYNARFHISETQRFRQINNFWKLTWSEGMDFQEELMQLLHKMLRKSPWREALAKAISILLESGWMDNKLGIDEQELEDALMPHQIDGLKRALWILENKGAVLVADATGSGKTKLGTWLCKIAWARKMKNNATVNLIPPTIHMPPNVEKSWDFETKMANYNPRLLTESYLSDQKKVLNISEVEWSRKQSPIIMYDEAHHFYTDSKRGKKARDHYADSVILLTATPLSKGVTDAENCIKLLGDENVDPEVHIGLKELKLDLKSGTKEERREKLAKAGRYLQSFTIRRTRNEINEFSDNNKDRYTIDGRQLKYPDSEAIYYDMEANIDDEKELADIREALGKIRGLHLIAEQITKTEKEENDSDETVLKRRVLSPKGLTRYHFWDKLISSRPAAIEHIRGTEEAWGMFGIKTDERKPLTGIISKLESMERPEILLDISEDKIKEMGFEYLISDEKWADAKLDELDAWDYIFHHVTRISDTRDSIKAEQLVKLFKQGKRILAFSQDIISLHYFLSKLSDEDVNIASKDDNPIVFDSSVEKTDAEEMFGLDTDHTAPLIGLFSNRFSEGVNLQSASTLVHLDTPTTVTVAEQRCGRVDRFNALHKKIEFYWPRDEGVLGEEITNKLRERNEFVEQTIGAQMKLPDDQQQEMLEEEYIDKNFDSLEQFAESLNLQNRVEINSLDDAFSGVRLLKEELIDDDIYDLIKDTSVKINSRVSILESRSPWFFCALGSQGENEKPPQWVLINLDMSTKTPLVHMTTDLSEISSFLLEELPLCEDVNDIDKINYPKWRKVFVNALTERAIKLVSPKQKSLLSQAESVIESWRKTETWLGENATLNQVKLMLKTGQIDNENFDLRDLADWWFQETKLIQQKTNSAKKRKKSRKNLVKDKALINQLKKNPIPFPEFIEKLNSIKRAEPIDARMISVIFAWPKEMKAPPRVQKFQGL